MRLILPIAMMFACATAVQAQEPQAAAPASTAVTAPAVEVAPGPRAPAAPALVTAPRIDIAPSAVAAVRGVERADTDAAVQQPPRNFWWLVGGIVLAGVILAILL